MKAIKKILIIISPIILIGLIIGGYFLSYDVIVERTMSKTEDENELFYDLLEENSVDIGSYSLYEEVFIVDGTYYIIFIDSPNWFYPAEGTIISGVLLEINTDIITEYRPGIDIEIRDELYILPTLWVDGSGSTISTAQSFFRRAELRRLIIENNNSITIENITIKIEGSYCLGKLEF